jgi:hypothetical protein
MQVILSRPHGDTATSWESRLSDLIMDLGFNGRRIAVIPHLAATRSTKLWTYPSGEPTETSKRCKVRSRKFPLPHPPCPGRALIGAATVAAPINVEPSAKLLSPGRTSVKSQQMELLQTHFSRNGSNFKSDCVSGYLNSFPALRLSQILSSRGSEKDAAVIQPKPQLQDQRRKNWMPI